MTPSNREAELTATFVRLADTLVGGYDVIELLGLLVERSAYFLGATDAGILLPDYLLTVLAAVVARQPRYLIAGLAFPLMRILDAFLCIRALVTALSADPTHGRWVSPQRRSIETVPASERPRSIEASLVRSGAEQSHPAPVAMAHNRD